MKRVVPAAKFTIRVAAALVSSVSFAAIDRANAVCTPATPVNGDTVTCSGNVSGIPFGFTSTSTGLTVNVQAGATVSGNEGINIADSTVDNFGTISGSSGSVHFTGSGTSTLILEGGSTLIGAAVNGVAGSTGKLVLKGQGTANNDFRGNTSLARGFTSLDMSNSQWTLNSNLASVGTATLTNSSLMVGDTGHSGAHLVGDVNLNASTLSGSGTIQGNVNIDGGSTLAPGAGSANDFLSVIGGNVTFSPDSKFVVRASPTTSTVVSIVNAGAVGGAATLGGASVFVQATGTGFAPSATYSILVASRGFGATRFGTVKTDLACTRFHGHGV